jgi:Gpi18-like mannosyltransferase
MKIAVAGLQRSFCIYLVIFVRLPALRTHRIIIEAHRWMIDPMKCFLASYIAIITKLFSHCRYGLMRSEP